MDLEIHVKGITKKWFYNIFLIFFGIVAVFEIMFFLFIHSYCYDSVKISASEYSKSFSVLSTAANSEAYAGLAREYAEQFEYKDRIEVQVLDSDGKMIVTTSGFQTDQAIMPDYKSAVQSPSGTGYWLGKNTSGKKVMAQTSVLADYGNGSNGAIRWVVAMKNVDRYIFLLDSIVVSIGIAIIAVTFFSGMYFVNSIVRPVSEVSNAARKIAMGDFSTKLQVRGKNEISELCDTINYMAGELAHAETIKNDFISSVSHELRTPLTAIRGWSETAKMSLDTSPELVSKGIDVVLSETERLSGLVEELLDFSRMQTGRLSVKMQKINPDDVLNEAVQMYSELAKQQLLELNYIPPKVPVYIMGDPDRLKQVFINVIDNAVKYTSSGGQILIEQNEDEGCVIVKVTDTGVGIPAADIDRVKEKFFKSNKTVRGSGIGLAVADEIIKQHNGLLFLESTEGVGTTVSIVLPLCEENEQTDEIKEKTDE